MIVIAYFLQTVIFPNLIYQTPNVLLIIVVFMGLMNEQMTGIIIGFITGLLLDSTYGSVFGVYSIIYMMIGFISGLYHRNFYGKSFLLPVFLLAVMDLFYGIIIYLLYFFINHGVYIMNYFKIIMIPETIYTVLFGILMYHIMYYINDRTL